ncbi:uncharacterized protein [Mytilus edulis]|uniref:uncharacterized protein n=1 Tax=Mytilus edulis TaxID=6550 RepID=UPI0039F071E6
MCFSIIEKELRGLGLETTDDLKDVMKLGSFKCFWNRVYIVGPYFSGKSCLAKLLVGDALPRERESTDGIWIYMGRAGMDLNGEEWIVIPKGTAVQEILVSMMMSLSTCESLDTDNLKTRLLESDENLHDSEVSRNSDHVEVLLLENSAQRKVLEERILQIPPMESWDAHDYTITPCLSNENAHINDTENESNLQTVILEEVNGLTVHGKNAFEEPTNAKQGIPLKRTRKTIVADTASHAHGVCVAAINTPRLCPEESRTSDVDELEHSPTEIPPKESSKSHVLPEEDSPTEVQSQQRTSSDLNFAETYSPGVDKALYFASTEYSASTDVSVEGSIAVETDLEINKSKNSAAGVIMSGVSSLKQILQVTETSNDYFDVTTKQESRTSDVLLEDDSPSFHSEQRRSAGLNFAEMFLPDVDKATYFASNEYIASTDVSVEDSIAVDTALETNKSANFAAGMKLPDVSSLEQRLQVSQTANDYFDLKTKQESSTAIHPKKDRSKSTNPVREKFKEKLMKEVANELSHNKLHEMVISSIREGKYKQKIIPIDIWDFGGQKDYYMTHQLFITSRGIFVLVFNGSLNLHKHMPDLSFLPGHFGKPTIAVYLLHWVNSILTYCKRSDDGFPRIVFVATHKDKIRKNVEKHKQKLMTVIEDIFKSHAGLKHLEFKPLIFVNAMNENDPEIQSLRQRLMDRAKEHPRWGEYMPTAWVPLELHLAQQAEKGVNILTKEQIQMFNSQNESMVLTSKQLETFLKVQHSLGKLLYFDIANLRDFVIITPAYLVEVLRSIVTEKQFWPKGKQFQSIFQTMQKTGGLSRDDIEILWNQDIFSHILSYKEFIIEVLVHLDILVAERRVTDDLSTALPEVSKFIVPSMITKPNNTKYLNKFCKSGTSILLSYKFTEKVIPPAFPYRFIASFVDMWRVKNYKNKKRMLFSDLAVVIVDDKHDVAVQVIGNRVVVSLINAVKKEHIIPTIATSVQECLTAAIHRISEFYSTLSADLFATDNRSDIHIVMPFEIEFGVHCRKASCFFPHDKIPTAAKWQCSEHKVYHDVSFLKLWFSEKMPREKCDKSCQGLGRLEIEQSPSNKHLRRLAASLEVKDCRELLIRLGLDAKVLNDVQDKFAPSAFHENDFKYTAMLRWKGSATDSSFARIQDALLETDKHLLCEVIRDVNVDDVMTKFSITEEQANKTPTNTTLQELSNHIGNSGIQLAVELGLQSAEIEGIQNDHSCKLLHQNKEILRVWSHTTFPKPTIKELIKALQRIGKKNCLREISF